MGLSISTIECESNSWLVILELGNTIVLIGLVLVGTIFRLKNIPCYTVNLHLTGKLIWT